jgi:hypothetical protein
VRYSFYGARRSRSGDINSVKYAAQSARALLDIHNNRNMRERSAVNELLSPIEYRILKFK